MVYSRLGTGKGLLEPAPQPPRTAKRPQKFTPSLRLEMLLLDFWFVFVAVCGDGR